VRRGREGDMSPEQPGGVDVGGGGTTGEGEVVAPSGSGLILFAILWSVAVTVAGVVVAHQTHGWPGVTMYSIASGLGLVLGLLVFPQSVDRSMRIVIRRGDTLSKID
jgi:hypothetical protein